MPVNKDANRFALDSNVFIEAHKRYYAFDICPGYWSALVANHHAGKILSVDRVRDEMVGKGDALTQWVKDLPQSFFASTADHAIVREFGDIIRWVQAQPQYFPAAKAKFAAEADGWLIAYAKVHNFVLATDEAPNPATRNKVPAPNVCNAFGVSYVSTFDLLRGLGSQFILKAAP